MRDLGFLLPFAVLIATSGPSIAAAMGDSACMVTDPTGTPLNVRAKPNGPILGALHNGAMVDRMETVADDRGRAWSFIVPTEGGKAGWVFREFVSCY